MHLKRFRHVPLHLYSIYCEKYLLSKASLLLQNNFCSKRALFCKKSDRLAQHGFWAILRHILPPFNAFKYIMPVRSYSSTFILNRIFLFFWHNLKNGKVKTIEKESIILSKPETFCTLYHSTKTYLNDYRRTSGMISFFLSRHHSMVAKVKRDRNYLWLAPQTCTLHRKCQHST